MNERLGFDRVPEIYDRVRPTYPDALFDELFAHLSTEQPSVVEIGAGTGKATGSLLQRGARVTAVEIGANLARFLRDKFAGDERLDVINDPFEDAELAPAAFDLVFAATAFHWVDPAVRYVKSHDLLRLGGVLAVVSTNQIRSDADHGYFARVQPLYRRYYPDEEAPDVPGEDVVPAELGEMQSGGLFEDVTLHRYRWDQTYTSAQYGDLVRSYANTQAMERSKAESLIAELCRVIDDEFGGSMVRPLVMTLTMGRKPAG